MEIKSQRLELVTRPVFLEIPQLIHIILQILLVKVLQQVEAFLVILRPVRPVTHFSEIIPQRRPVALEVYLEIQRRIPERPSLVIQRPVRQAGDFSETPRIPVNINTKSLIFYSDVFYLLFPFENSTNLAFQVERLFLVTPRLIPARVFLAILVQQTAAVFLETQLR